ncbi:MAG: class I SAM-dependent methyltransferase [Desulfamplus sp.]|nr:class I SAM-dependent methyltransferase [Desulfamplus sp.]
MMLDNLIKNIPMPVKRAVGEPLRRILSPPVPPPSVPSVIMAGKPGTDNLWWKELEKVANKRIFPELTPTARQACAGIREAYRPVLERYDVSADDFFWGSIKNEEAEALYQSVLDRKPGITYQVGTFVGYSALVIAHALRANGSGVLIAVDPEIPHRTFINPVNVAREAAKLQGLDRYIRFERGWHSGPLGDYIGRGLKRSIPVIGREVMDTIRDQGIDLAFIDGDHSSACTLTDFLLMKDYLNLNGVVLFHDVLTWPTVAQAILLIWHDIHYFVRGTPAYFALDVRSGQDGLAALERINDENFPTLCLKIENSQGEPVADARVVLPCADFTAVSDKDGIVYLLSEISEGSGVTISHPDYLPFQGVLARGTQGDFAQVTLQLTAA